jgi:hypothetical protein
MCSSRTITPWFRQPPSFHQSTPSLSIRLRDWPSSFVRTTATLLEPCRSTSEAFGTLQRHVGLDSNPSHDRSGCIWLRSMVPHPKRTQSGVSPFHATLQAHLIDRFCSLHSLVRSTVLLTITCCYVMWAIVYLAQLHPVISESQGVTEL